MSGRLWIPAALLVLLALPLAAGAPATPVVAAHYIPHSGDRFQYDELTTLGNGTGVNYTGYTETTITNGSEWITAVSPEDTVSAAYFYSVSYSNSTGSSERWTSSGAFSFSAVTYRYVSGTDNQTGYYDPYVWFYMNNSLVGGGGLTLLNTGMSVVSTDDNYDLGGTTGRYVVAIFTEGNGTFFRDDSYGQFTAVYTWKVYFDPSTGYIVGYLYTEQDTNAANGEGFTITDILYVTSTTYPLTPGVAPPPAPASNSGGSPSADEIALIAAIVVVVLVVLALILSRSRRRASLPRHSATGNVGYYAPPPAGSPTGVPPPINLTPSGQPAVQQIVLRETVKVNCRYCGTLMDSTATVCPNCGAPRT